MSKGTYRIRNRREYNKSLVQRGSITFWINEKVLQEWKNPSREHKRGRPRQYGNLLIEAILIVRSIYHLPLIAVEGFMRSVTELYGPEIGVPDYTTICKRQKTVKMSKSNGRESTKVKHIVMDTTGLKFYGEGEWKVKKKWNMPIRNWALTISQLDIYFEGRLNVGL